MNAPLCQFDLPHQESFLAAYLHRTVSAPKALALIAHGLYSSGQSEKLNRLAAAMAQAGYAALLFDHAGCGRSPGLMERTTISRRLAEFLSAADFLQNLGPGLPLIYMGSSLGGVAALLAGASVPPACTVCWSTPSDLNALVQRHRNRAEAWNLPDFGPDLALHDLDSVLRGTRRVYFIHGEEDEVVPVSDAHRAHGLALAPKGLFTLPGADHRLSRLNDQDQAIDHTLAWIERMAV